MASNTTKRGLTGGGEFDDSALNSLDQQMARLITKEEVVGIQGAMEIGLENPSEDEKSEQSPVHFLHMFIL